MAIAVDKMNFLIIDPEPEVHNILTLGLSLRWPDCTVFGTSKGVEGIKLVETELPQLIITEIDLPDIDGFTIIRQVRLFTDVPIIVLSDRNDELSIVKALELGADDYVFKPPSPLDFLARSRAVLRRSVGYPSRHEDLPPYIAGSLIIDFSSHQVFIEGEQVHVTPVEYLVLCQLVRNEGRVVAVDALRRRIDSGNDDVSPDTIRKSVCQLRQKLDECTSNACLILNERGVGYRFVSGNHRNTITALAPK